MHLTYRPIAGDWPGELTVDRKPSPFEADWASTLDLLEREVAHLQHVDRSKYHPTAVLQLAVPEGAIRQDGQLMSGRKPPEHPGVILNVETSDGPLRFACDRFASSWRGRNLDPWRHNLRAVALGMEALRKVERYGLGTGHEQYVGFQALPPATPMGAAKLTVEQAIAVLRDRAPDVEWDWDDPEGVKRAFRVAAASSHPDAGGDPAAFRLVTEARDLLLGVADGR